jgi:hypothetical protein
MFLIFYGCKEHSFSLWKIEDLRCQQQFPLWKTRRHTFFVISSDSEKSHATEPVFLAIVTAKMAYSAS